VPALAPRLLATREQPPGEAILFLEALRPASRWPWRDVAAAGSVLERIALVHRSSPLRDRFTRLSPWDYEADLLASAERTLEQLQRLRRTAPHFGNGTRWARRLVARLPALRRHLLGFAPFGSTMIHGDLHSGNVIVRRRNGLAEPVLLDWGRARLGSPLEDVASWLQSLAAWEPEARRRHDTLLGGYLAAWGLERRLGRELRATYWLAGASNALAGALSSHLSVLAEPMGSPARVAGADWAARHWLRVLRRADACWN
jgi:Ser/Thr protein kinase RdoA (MazF antagonist)